MMVMVEHLKKGDWVRTHNFSQILPAKVTHIEVEDERTILFVDAQDVGDLKPRVYMNGTPLQTDLTEEGLLEISKMQLRKLAGLL